MTVCIPWLLLHNRKAEGRACGNYHFTKRDHQEWCRHCWVRRKPCTMLYNWVKTTKRRSVTPFRLLINTPEFL